MVLKKAPGEYRLIHHMSFPNRSYINDRILDKFSSVQYATICDAIQKIKMAGQQCHLAKTYVKIAFRIISVSPSDYQLLGMEWQGFYSFDKCMPMGFSSSCKTFELVNTALEWVAHKHVKIDYTVYLLDDFFIIAPSFQQCKSQLSNFITFCDFVDVPIAPQKTCGPSTVLSFAGIELAINLFEARPPGRRLRNV